MRISGSLARYSTKSTYARTRRRLVFVCRGRVPKHATRHDGEGLPSASAASTITRRLVGVHSHQNVARRQSTTHGIGHVPPKLRLDVFEPSRFPGGAFSGDAGSGGSARRSTRRRPRRC